MRPNKVLKDGKVAVLISPGYGAGWSSWNAPDYQEMMIFDERFVQAALAGASFKEVHQLALKVFGLGPDDYICTSGWDDIKVEWVDVGTSFEIEVYDGSERIRYLGHAFRA